MKLNYTKRLLALSRNRNKVGADETPVGTYKVQRKGKSFLVNNIRRALITGRSYKGIFYFIASHLIKTRRSRNPKLKNLGARHHMDACASQLRMQNGSMIIFRQVQR